MVILDTVEQHAGVGAAAVVAENSMSLLIGRPMATSATENKKMNRMTDVMMVFRERAYVTGTCKCNLGIAFRKRRKRGGRRTSGKLNAFCRRDFLSRFPTLQPPTKPTNEDIFCVLRVLWGGAYSGPELRLVSTLEALWRPDLTSLSVTSHDPAVGASVRPGPADAAALRIENLNGT